MFPVLAGGNPSGYYLTNSLRTRASASAYLSRTPASSSSQSRYTLSFWAKRGTLGANQTLLSCVAYGNTSYQTYFRFNSSDQLEFYNSWGSDLQNLITTQVFRDPSAWYHIVFAINMNGATRPDAIQISVNGSLITAFSTTTYTNVYQATAINSAYAHNFCRDVNTSSSYADQYLAEMYFVDGQQLTPSSFGSTNPVTGVWQPRKYGGTYGTNGYYLSFANSSTSTYSGLFNRSTPQYLTVSNTSSDFSFGTGAFTIECWVKLNSLPSGTGYPNGYWLFGGGLVSSNTGIDFYINNTQIGFNLADFTSPTAIGNHNMVPGQWYHLAVVRGGTSNQTLSLYVNGTRVATASSVTATADASLTGIAISAAEPTGATSGNVNGYISNYRIVKGSAVYDPTQSSLTVPSTALTAITNTVLLTLQNATIVDNSSSAKTITNVGSTTTSVQYPFVLNIAADYSGNSNNWTPNNISLALGSTYDSMTDVPTLTNATAANYAVLNPLSNSTNTLSGANLNIASASGNANTRCNSTIAVSSGKWYYEVVLTGVGTNSSAGIGQSQITNAWPGNDALSYAYELDNARIANNGSLSSYGSALVLNDVFMCAFDLDNNKIFFGKNGTWFNSSNPATGTSPAYTLTAGTYCPIFRPYNSNSTGASFGVNFGQRPFSYTAPTGFVALNTYNLPTSTIVKGNTVMDATTYTGTGASLSVTNTASFKPDLVWVKSRSNATDNELTDSVRGVTKSLISNSTAAEATDTQGLTAFNSNGFTLGTDANYNGSGRTFVGWQWQAGQGSSSSNTNGTITSTVSVNASAGFSIVTYTGNGTAGATVGHGLGVAPSFIVTFARNTVTNHAVYHVSMGNTKAMKLNLTSAEETFSGWWNNTSPTSSVFSIGTFDETNKSSTTYVAYCFASIAGYSSFGSYTGNGSTDGPFVYTGFRPKFIMSKVTTASNWWIMFDSTRNPYNAANFELSANLSDAEYTANTSQYTLFDFLSNGFKLRTGSLEGNSNGQTYIYMAFAENPFKNALAR